MNQDHETRYVRVIIDRAIHRELDYSLPETLAERVGVGSRVRVPFRDKSALATVVAILEQSDAKGIRPIEAIVGDGPVLSEHVARTGEVDERLLLLPDRNGDAQSAAASDPARGSRLEETAVRSTARSIDSGEIEKLRRRAPRQAELLEAISKLEKPIRAAELLRQTSLDNQTLRALVKRGLVELREEAVVRDPHGDEQFIATSNLDLNEEQTHALNEVEQALAHRKTRVRFCSTASPAAARPRFICRPSARRSTADGPRSFSSRKSRSRRKRWSASKAGSPRAQDEVAVLHSHLSEGERHDEWHKIHSGRARIVIGARSAVFAPLKNLGLIVVDEEHETTYKQEEAPRYHARDVAVVRAKIEKCVVVLGSATPSLESYHNATTGKYQLVTLTQRVDEKQMPLIRIVDLRQERRKEKIAAILSEKLSQAIADRLEKREQTILFLNRRGFSTSLLCSNCGEARNCPNCSVALTFHAFCGSASRSDAGRLSCHLCGHTAAVPKKCPECGKDALIYPGFGTEKVESTVAQIFPKAVVRRMDADSMTRKEAYRETLRNFRTGKIDILVGTQMIAKGLHFPNVTLVGIINADLALHLPDFRAGERTFQLLTQVAGRAGRGETHGRSLRANLHAIQSLDSICAPPRFRRLFPAGARVSRALRFSAIQTRSPDHRPFGHEGRAKLSAETLGVA